MPSSTIIHKRHQLPLFDSDSQCLLDHYDHGTLITDICARAITEAPHKLQEIELETGAGFLWVTLLFSHLLQGIVILFLIRLFFLRGALERKFERNRRRLESELHDPFLRRVIEEKASKQRGQLPEGVVTGAQFVALLQRRTETWDSKAKAVTRVRSMVRKCRVLLLVCLGATIFLYLVTWIFQDDVSFVDTSFLESIIVDVLCFTLTYWIPLEQQKKKKIHQDRGYIGTLAPRSSASDTVHDGQVGVFAESELDGVELCIELASVRPPS
jgi:hypothetical protein